MGCGAASAAGAESPARLRQFAGSVAAAARSRHDWKAYFSGVVPSASLRRLAPPLALFRRNSATAVTTDREPDVGGASGAPALLSDRILNFAGVVGRENVIAGADCGLSGRAPRSAADRSRKQAPTGPGSVERGPLRGTDDFPRRWRRRFLYGISPPLIAGCDDPQRAMTRIAPLSQPAWSLGQHGSGTSLGPF